MIVTNSNAFLIVTGLMFCLFAASNGLVLAFPPDQRVVVQSTWFLPLSTSDTRNILSDFAGNAYFSETNDDQIGRLEPTSNMITEWEIASNASMSANLTGVAFDPTTGSIYFTESGTNKIGRLEPATNTITEWGLTNSSENETLRDIVVQPDVGNLYFLADNGYSIKNLDPSTNTFTEWKLPIPTSNISDIVWGFDGVFFTESGTNKIGRLAPTTNMITEWRIPSDANLSANPTKIAFDPTTGSIYFTESGTNKIGRLEPSRDVITKWDVGSKPLTVTVTPAGSVFYVDDLGRIGRLG
jgi:virginiamycin B lyase